MSCRRKGLRLRIEERIKGKRATSGETTQSKVDEPGSNSATVTESGHGGSPQEPEAVTSDGSSSGPAGNPHKEKNVADKKKSENRKEQKEKKKEALQAVRKAAEDMNPVVRTAQEIFKDGGKLKELMDAIEKMLQNLSQEVSAAEKPKSGSEVVEVKDARTSQHLSLVERCSALCGEFFMRAFDGFKRTGDYTEKIFDPQGDMVTKVSDAFSSMGQLHWAGLLLSGVAFALKHWQLLGANKEGLINIVRSMQTLGGAVVEAVMKAPENPPETFKRAVQEAVRCILDCLQDSITEIEKNSVQKFLFGDLTSDLLEKHQAKIKSMYGPFNTALLLDIKDEVTQLKEGYRLVATDEELDKGDPAIGIEDTVSKLKEMLNISEEEDQTTKINAVLIHGMGGIGKSTLGKHVYYCVAGKEFKKDRTCILDMSPPNTVEKLQHELLFRFERRDYNPASKSVMKQRLVDCFKKLESRVFIFVDNVEEDLDLSLEKLFPNEIIHRLPPGSCLLVASRNDYVRKSLVDIGIDSDRVQVFPMSLLDQDSSRSLFRRHALRDSNEGLQARLIQYEEQVLRACDGLPLALKVIGSYLYDEHDSEEAWDSVVQWLNQSTAPDGTSDDKLFKVLKFSYDRLKPAYQQVFLDIGFCFNQSPWSDMKILYGQKLETLRRRALIMKEVKDFKNWGLHLESVKVHSCFTSLCRQIATEERSHIKIDFSRQSWNSQQVPEVLVLEGGSRGGYETLEAADLNKLLSSLRILVMTDVKFRGDCQQVPSMLNCLYCHHSNVPFPLSKLDYLTLVDISSAIDTEYTIPSAVKKLRLDAPSLEKLQFLNCRNSNLQELGLMFCPRLRLQADYEQATFSSLRKVVLRHGTYIAALPTQFMATELHSISVQNCSRFSLPRDLSSFKNLEHLHISGVQEYVELPENCSSLEKLMSLTLEDCPLLEKLPEDMGSSSKFQLLEIKGCPSLRALPGSIHDWVQEKQDHPDNTSQHRVDDRREESSESSRWLKSLGNAEEIKQKATAAKYMIPLIHTRGAYNRINDLVYELYCEDEPDVEIVFLPGIHVTRDNREAHWRTWTRKNNEECWLQTLLPQELKRSFKPRILTVSYESLLDSSVEPEELLAKAMIRDLILHPESCVGQRHPVFLVAHGLGGIVIKYFVKTVVEKLEREEEDETTRTKLERFCNNLKAFCFYSTPMSGSAAMERLAESIPKESPDKMLRFVKVLNTEMADLNAYIAKARGRYKIKSFALCETNETNQGDYRNIVVVPEGSARQDVDSFRSVQEDHYGITQANNKFSKSVAFLVQNVEDILTS